MALVGHMLVLDETMNLFDPAAIFGCDPGFGSDLFKVR